MDDIIKAISLFAFSVLAGTVRFLNNEIHKISMKELCINAMTALLSGMLIYFLTAEMECFRLKPLMHAGVVGLAGYMAPETLKVLQITWLKKLKEK